MAAEIKDQYPDTEVTLIHSRDHLLSAEPLPVDFGEQTVKALRDMDVNVVLGKRVIDVVPGSAHGVARSKLILSNSTTMHASHVINAISRPVPTGSYLGPQALNQDHEVVVRATLQFADNLVNSDSHFAVGDLAAWPPNSAPVVKRCGAAMYQGSIAAFNIHQHMLFQSGLVEAPQCRTLPIYAPVMALALGKTAIGYSPQNGVTSGKGLCETMFGGDLGFTICWKHLGLGTEE